MFVIADFEWITNAAGHHSPTQLAAIRVDDEWNEVSVFKALIRPRDSEFHDWSHVAYTGGTATDFLHARNAHNVFSDFEEWLSDDDILLWWYSESEMLFKKLVSLILKVKENHKAVSINEYVYSFLDGEKCSRGNAYRIAEARGVKFRDSLKHSSINDCNVIMGLMAAIKYPQEKLLCPVERKPKETASHPTNAILPYQYDTVGGLIHKLGCEHIGAGTTIGYPNFKTPLRKGYKPCECCKQEYQAAVRERNYDIISRTQYTYIFSPDSKVYHKYTCGLMLGAKVIKGTRTYEAVAATNRTPCKLCNPTPNDTYRPLPPALKVARLQKKKLPSIPKEAAKAIKRQRVASQERYSKLKDKTLSQEERDDVFTLTQPEFAFFVSKGYQTFHLRSCNRLKELSNIKGFKTYNDAVRAGYTPCKRCKPTPKQDVKVSIPIKNRIRADETITDLETLCRDAGYSFSQTGPDFIIVTPVGKWSIDVSSSPLAVKHINLAVNPNTKTYHKQPRAFLSFIDVFDYIKRHDSELERKKNNGSVYVKLFDED